MVLTVSTYLLNLQGMTIKQPKQDSFSITPRHIYALGAFLFLSVILTYISIQFIPFVFSPEVIVTSPVGNNIIVNSQDIFIEGNVKSTRSLTLNGDKVYIGENGDFREPLKLREGINTVALEAKSIFGRSKQLVTHIVYIKS